jgi:hypothetical protein
MSLPPPSLKDESTPAGSLTRQWTIAIVVTQLLIVGALIAVAISSRSIGKPTWWLGYEYAPAFFLLWFLPFIAPAGMIFAAFKHSRLLPFVGLASTLLLGVTSGFDVSRTPGIAICEILLTVCTALSTIAALAGRRRSVTTGI